MTDTISPISLGMRSPHSNFIAVWRLKGEERVHLPRTDPKMKILYPSDQGIRLETEGDGISVIFPRKMMACILTLDQ
jgi:hypothetical protein